MTIPAKEAGGAGTGGVADAGHTWRMRIDLHTHSTVSDGTESPVEVMRAAAAAGLDVVALTDHDAMDGWDAGAAEAERLGIGFVPGIEVSCSHKGMSIHLLAYWPRRDDPALTSMLALTREARVERAREIVRRVGEDYPLTWDAVAARSGDAATVGRPHIADALVDGGAFPDRDAVFAQVLAGNSKYYVPHYAPQVVDAVRALRAAGGVPVFAHPGADGRGRIVATSVIEAMADAGMVGLEVDHRDHSPAQRERLGAIAERLGLVRTGASDYHGAGKANRLGEELTTPEAYAALVAARG
jgi:predicted metal-dependent phosphoesterase TrpH